MAVIDAPISTEPDIDTEVNTVLERMEALLRERGWCQDRDENAMGQFCLRGALYEVRPSSSSASMSIRTAVRDRIVSHIGGRNYMTWNDAPGRTVDDVYDLLQRARTT